MTSATNRPDGAGAGCWATRFSVGEVLPVVFGAARSPCARARTCFCSLSRFIASPDTNERPSVTNATAAGKIAFHILRPRFVVDAPLKEARSTDTTIKILLRPRHPSKLFRCRKIAWSLAKKYWRDCGGHKEVSGHRKLMR